MDEQTKKHFYKNIGLYVTGLRKEKNLTQSKLGEKVSLTQGYISSIEHGDATITIDLWVDICKALNVNPGPLLSTSASPGEIPIDKHFKERLDFMLNTGTSSGHLIEELSHISAHDQMLLYKIYKVLKSSGK